MNKTIENLSPDSALVYKYLRLMESRKIDKAKKVLSENFTMTFPGSMKFEYLEELINYGKKRQVSVFKTFESFEEVIKDYSNVIYVRGKLFGKSIQNIKFNNIRYIDKFILSNKKFIRQEVWNDFAINNQIKDTYPMPEKSISKIERDRSDLDINSEILEFIFSLDCKQEKIKSLFLDQDFIATMPGNILLKINDFLLYLEKEKKFSERKLWEVNLVESKNFKIVYLDGSISGLDSEGKKYKNIRFIERLKFDSLSKKIISYELWDDLADHGF